VKSGVALLAGDGTTHHCREVWMALGGFRNRGERIQTPSVNSRELVAANHGQLLEKLKAAPQTEPLKSMMSGIEGLLVTGINPDPSIRLNLTVRR
jgi:hypothetical protein